MRIAAGLLLTTVLSAQPAVEILRRNCTACHNTQNKTSGLALDSREALLKGGTRGPGQLAAAIRHDGALSMPPGKKLADADIAKVEAWLEQGAPWTTSRHWSLIAPRKAPVPAGAHPIDHFINARLRAEKIAPSPEADRVTLIRRLTYDLTGLPPTPAEVDAFLGDGSPNAWSGLIDRLLAAPQYGERWARHWLDQARYADSDGGSRDEPRHVWKYRDWVIDSLNRDQPFDRFITEQVAGDLIPNAETGQIIATGFLRHHQIQIEAGTDREQYRVESVFDRVDTTGTVFLGLSVGCARCHDHKFDPIAQRDYYRLFALFNNNDEWDNSKPYYDTKTNNIDVIHAPVLHLPDGTKSMVFRELPQPRESYIMKGGDFLQKGPAVTPGVPASLHPVKDEIRTRLDLASWLTEPENPLVARVAVNRIWQAYFGRGLVETENDFGTQGSKPTHPELLDWLAAEFVESGWSRKHIHRFIVTSETYRRSSRGRPDLDERDSGNYLLARQARFRYEAEGIRDAALVASGLLTSRIGGPSVFPPQPANAMAASQLKKEWKVSTGPDRYRRGLYTFFYRITPHPALTVFDQPNATQACTRRSRSNTPLQALTLLNDDAFHEFAQAFARRIAASAGDDKAKLDFAYRTTVARKPDSGEQARLLRLLAIEKDAFQSNPESATQIAGTADPEQAAWIAVARVLLNTDEFMTRE